MSCNSALYTANTSEQELLANAQIPFGTIVRRFGRFCNIQGSDVVIGDCCSKDGNGYYSVDCSVTLEPTAIGNVSAQLYVNGEAYPGAQATGYSATAGNPVNLSFPAVVRLYGCCNLATLQIRLGDEGATVTNMGFRVKKD
jgi:hypothetical protein